MIVLCPRATVHLTPFGCNIPAWLVPAWLLVDMIGPTHPGSSLITCHSSLPLLVRHFGDVDIEAGAGQQRGEFEGRKPVPLKLGSTVKSGLVFYGLASRLEILQVRLGSLRIGMI